MKRVLLILSSVVCIVFIYAGSQMDLLNAPDSKPVRRSCSGYEVIEAGKGINCHGDTIKLTKKSGYYEVAVNYDPH
jgi:hypothetical protein